MKMCNMSASTTTSNKNICYQFQQAGEIRWQLHNKLGAGTTGSSDNENQGEVLVGKTLEEKEKDKNPLELAFCE